MIFCEILPVFQVDDDAVASTILHYHLAGVRWEIIQLCFVYRGYSVALGFKDCPPRLSHFLLTRQPRLACAISYTRQPEGTCECIVALG